jgi:hypothetical protein
MLHIASRRSHWSQRSCQIYGHWRLLACSKTLPPELLGLKLSLKVATDFDLEAVDSNLLRPMTLDMSTHVYMVVKTSSLAWFGDMGLLVLLACASAAAIHCSKLRCLVY